MEEIQTTPVLFGSLGAGVPRLVLLRSPMVAAVGRTFAIATRPSTIGRSPSADLHIEDSGISRRHARVVREPGGQIAVEDLGSTNGTFVNGRRVTRAVLCEGDRVQVGSMTVLRFTSERENSRSATVGRALAAAGIGLWEWSVAQARMSGSPNLDRVLGLAVAELAGPPERLLEIVAPEQRTQVRREVLELLAQSGAAELELRLELPEGTRWVRLQAEVLRDEDGAPLFVAGTAIDLTAAKSAEAELHRQALIFESLYDAVVLCDLSGRITDWNPSAARAFHHTKAEALGREVGELMAPAGAQTTETFLSAIARDGRWNGEVTLDTPDGRQRVLEAVAVPLRSAEGRAMAHIIAFRDVSERKRMEARLLLADRMASVGTLAAGVAHEINNPLAFIRANLGYLSEQVERVAPALAEELPEVRQVLTETQEGVRRIETIVRDLKTFSRADERGEVEAVNLKRMLSFAIKMVENQVRHRAQLSVDVAENLWVRGNEARLGQVFVNLLVNASHAIPDGAAQSHAIRVRASAFEGCVVTEIEDTGAGMSAEVRARIFSPFFTTKRVGEGTGLGLSVSHAIVSALGGEIGVDSEPGRGSTFRVRLPAARDPESPPTPVPAQGDGTGRRHARVLVVDDDALVASAITRSLAPRHQVTAVRSGREALQLLARRAFDLVLCDLMMPDIGGMDLHAALAEKNPALLPRLAFVTGGAFTARAEAFLASVQNPVVRKPFSTAELYALVDRTLETLGRCEQPGATPALRAG